MAENDILIENPQVPDIVFEQIDYKLEFYGDIQGESLYVSWLGLGNVGTKEDFLLWLKGDKGDKGDPGQDGGNGTDGMDGQDGQNGKSAYQSYLDTTSDNPPMTEALWANQLGDILTILNSI